MADNSKKISELPISANVDSTDRIVILKSPSSNASVQTVNVSTFAANLTISSSVPATSSSNGVAGTIRFDTNYVYVCVANNTWKRSPLTTW